MENINLKKWGLYVGLIVVGVLIGLFVSGSSDQQTPSSSHRDHDHGAIADVYTCSMHPQVRADSPGDCPICGMDLVKVRSLQGEIGDNEIQMTEAAVQLANIQTTKVSSGAVTKVIKLQGTVSADERRLSSVTAHFDGRVEKLFADFTGQYIKRGQKLATLYSPDLVTAQKELFEALKLKDANPSFYEAAIQKLKLWELTDDQINNIIQRGEPQYYFDVYAHRPGTVQTKNVSEGEHIMDGAVMFEIADLNHVWVLFEVYESDLPWISPGDSISFYIPSIPGRQFQSTISFIDPVVNKQTRTVSIRLEVDNLNNQLKPEMFAEGIVRANLKGADGSIMVPKSAVLWTGKRSIVYVKQPGYDQPTFQFREVQLGMDAGEYYVVQEGLTEGEEIATNGVFKIDAAAQLQGKVSMMNPEGWKASSGHQHGQMPDGLEKESAPAVARAEENVPGRALEADEVFRAQLKKVFEAYLPVKDALVESDVKKAAQLAGRLLVALNGVDMGLVKGEAHAAWMQDLAVLKPAVEVIMKGSELETSRVALAPLSDQLYHSLVKFKVKGLRAFRQYCPMAFDFKGAYWLSNSDEILNPYFGDEMLTCGNVEAELN